MKILPKQEQGEIKRSLKLKKENRKSNLNQQKSNKKQKTQSNFDLEIRHCKQRSFIFLFKDNIVEIQICEFIVIKPKHHIDKKNYGNRTKVFLKDYHMQIKNRRLFFLMSIKRKSLER